jgi:hypothetical protein
MASQVGYLFARGDLIDINLSIFATNGHHVLGYLDRAEYDVLRLVLYCPSRLKGNIFSPIKTDILFLRRYV